MLTLFLGCASARSTEKPKNKIAEVESERRTGLDQKPKLNLGNSDYVSFEFFADFSPDLFFPTLGRANKFGKFLWDSLLNELGKNIARLFDKFAGNKGNDLWPVVIDYQIMSGSQEMGKQI